MSEIDNVARSLLRHSAGERVYDSGSPGDLKSDIMKLANAWLASTTKATPKDNRSRTMAELSREERERIAEQKAQKVCERISEGSAGFTPSCIPRLYRLLVEEFRELLPGPNEMDWTWTGSVWLSNPPGYRINIAADGFFRVWKGGQFKSVVGNPCSSWEEAKQAAQKDWEGRK